MSNEAVVSEKPQEEAKAVIGKEGGGKGKGKLVLVYLLLLAAGLFLGILFGYLI